MVGLAKARALFTSVSTARRRTQQVGTNLAMEGVDVPPSLDDNLLLLGKVNGHIDDLGASQVYKRKSWDKISLSAEGRVPLWRVVASLGYLFARLKAERSHN